MARAKDAPAQVGGQIDPYVQRSMQQSKQQAQNRLLAATQEAGATRRAAKQESGAMMRSGMQIGAQAVSQAAQEEAADRRAAEREQGRREDRKYQEVNAEANRSLQREITNLNIQLRKDEMAQDLESAEKTVDLQIDLATIDVAHKAREGKGTRNMIQSLFATNKEQEAIKQKKITNFINSKNEYDRAINVHSQTGTAVGDRLRDDPKMRLDIPKKGVKSLEEIEKLKSKPFAAIQDQISLSQSKVELESLFPENIHKVDKQLSQEDLTMVDIRKTWSVVKGAIPVISERIKEAEDDENKLVAGYWRGQRRQLNNILVSVQGLMNSDTPLKNRPNATVGSMVSEALGPMLGLGMGAEVNEFIKSGMSYEGISDLGSKSWEPYGSVDVPGLKTDRAKRFLVGINSILTNQEDIETGDFIEAGGIE